MPTRVAVDTTSVWKEESPLLVLVLFAHGARSYPGNSRTGSRRVRKVNQIPAVNSSTHHQRDADAAAHWQREQIAPQQAVNKFNKMGQQEQGLLVG